jgi:hypothetical protein
MIANANTFATRAETGGLITRPLAGATHQPQSNNLTRKSEAFTIWTDGGCWPNPGGHGGWAAIIRQDNITVAQLSGGDPSTTNNRMEIAGAIAALEYLPAGATATIYSDSQYLVNAMSVWIHN